MTSRILLSVLCLLAGTSVYAQKFSYGIIGGISHTSITSEVYRNIPNYLEMPVPSGIGYSAGPFLRYHADEAVSLRLSARYHTLSSEGSTPVQTGNHVIASEQFMTHEEEYLNLGLTAEIILIQGKVPLGFTVGLAGNHILRYNESRSYINTDIDSGEEVTRNTTDVSYDPKTILALSAGLKTDFGPFGIGIEASLFGNRWEDSQQMRTFRAELLGTYAF